MHKSPCLRDTATPSSLADSRGCIRCAPPPKSSSIGLKKRQSAPFSFTAFNFFPADQNIVSNSVRTHHYHPYFFFKSQNFSNIVSNSVRKHHFTVDGINIIRWDQPTTSRPPYTKSWSRLCSWW